MTDSESPAPELRVNGGPGVAPADGVVRVGRDPRCEVVYDDGRVSREHGLIELLQGAWVYRDTSSRGTYRDGARVTELPIEDEVVLRLGHPATGPLLTLEVAQQVVEAAPPEPAPPPPREPPSRPQHEPIPEPRTPPVAAASAIRTPPPSTGPGRPADERTAAQLRLGHLSVVHEARPTALRIGREPDSDLVIDDLIVSRRHAEVRPTRDGYELVDLGSHNGTFLNGRRVDRAPLSDGDLVTVATHVFRFVGGRLEEYIDQGHAWLLGKGLSTWTPDGRQILDDVSFALPPASFLAVVGPSGSGKSTLLGALTGVQPANNGSVWYGGRDVYEAHEDLRLNMGLVPQTDILHTELTVRAALRYAAALRFPPDVDAAARNARVDEVIAELGLAHRADVPIERLSGGQRKRTSVALELLTRPALLFLDEPTSGLDPANEEQVTELLRDLAREGRIVAVATHSVEMLRQADRVIFLAPGGRLAFFGRPNEALGYFGRQVGATDFPAIFRALESDPEADWPDRFTADQAYEDHVRGPLAQAEVKEGARRGVEEERPPRGPSWPSQYLILVRRYLAVLAADRRNVALMAVQAPFFALLFLFLFMAIPQVMSCLFAENATILIWLMVVGATWLGTANSIREIVKELPIYRRERSVGLSRSAYLMSKVSVLSVITLAQTAVMVLIVFAVQPLPTEGAQPAAGTVCRAAIDASMGSALLPSARLELIAGIGMAGVAAMAFGLLVSAMVTRVDKAATILPYLLIVQTVLSQPFLENRALDVAGHLASARWGVAAAGSTLDFNRLRSENRFYQDFAIYARTDTVPAGRASEFEAIRTNPAAAEQVLAAGGYAPRATWRQDPGSWLLSVVVLGLMSAVALAGAAFFLKRHDDALLGSRQAERRKRRTATAPTPTPR